jgi:methylenetetrahydrofolate--tRNA-(uracil-5-)-methyltransferase
LASARRHRPHGFEEGRYFEGCLPAEVIAQRGPDALRFGPMRPVGLVDPREGRRPYAVIQLRQENLEGTMYNLVGFQTQLAQEEQRRVLRMVPGLAQAEFLRYGSIHRNTYLNSPVLLGSDQQLRTRSGVFCAGQLTGVEGYVESIASGLWAGINLSRYVDGKAPLTPPEQTICGALFRYISSGGTGGPFQPMNANFGLLPPLGGAPRAKAERCRALADRALAAMRDFVRDNQL